MLKNKWLMVAIGLVAGLAYLLVSNQIEEELDPLTIEALSKPESTGLKQRPDIKERSDPITMAKRDAKRKQAEKLLPKAATKVTLTEVELQNLRSASLAKQEEINMLMTQYSNQSLAVSERKEVKAKLKRLMDEYNEMVLPLALKAMEEKGQG